MELFDKFLISASSAIYFLILLPEKAIEISMMTNLQISWELPTIRIN
jgi:hypothetical protein